MKHVIVMALGAALALASCVSKGTVVKVEEQRDSLSVVVSAKDSLINAVFEDIGSISENLALIRTLNTEKIELENQLNTVYYIVGTEKELREAQIINKQGFIGRTLTVNKTDNLASFTKSDSRLLSEVPIGQKKVSVVTTHPEESYELVTDADKVVLKLLITDPVRFWESSKILIVSYK